MPLTAAKLAANRDNAQKSTGPRSVRGKARAAQNATTHGLSSRRVLLPDEDLDDWAAYRDRLVAALAPDGALEELLADRLIEIAWRLRRAGAAEAGFLRRQIHKSHEQRLHVSEHDRLWEAMAPVPPDAAEQARALVALRDSAENDLGHAVSLQIDTLTKLSRYEIQLERSLHKTLAELARVRAARQSPAKRATAVIDVGVDADG